MRLQLPAGRIDGMAEFIHRSWCTLHDDDDDDEVMAVNANAFTMCEQPERQKAGQSFHVYF